MTDLSGREKDFENKYAHDEKIGFKIEARTSKLFGLWAAEKMGLTGEQAQNYALDVVNANLEEAGFDDVLNKVSADFKAKDIDISPHMMKVELDKAHTEARRQIMSEVK